jgi:hypothetical protein
MWCLFCDVPCIVCVYMCTEQLPPGGYLIAVKYIISYHISYHIICEVCEGASFYFQSAWALHRGRVFWTGVLEVSLKITIISSFPWYARHVRLKNTGLPKQGFYPVKIKTNCVLNSKPKLTCFYLQSAQALYRGRVFWAGVIEISLKIANICFFPCNEGHVRLKNTGLSNQEFYPVKLKTSCTLNSKPKLTCWTITQNVIFPSSLVICNLLLYTILMYILFLISQNFLLYCKISIIMTMNFIYVREWVDFFIKLCG